jgi:hypothetical protein
MQERYFMFLRVRHVRRARAGCAAATCHSPGGLGIHRPLPSGVMRPLARGIRSVEMGWRPDHPGFLRVRAHLGPNGIVARDF